MEDIDDGDHEDPFLSVQNQTNSIHRMIVESRQDETTNKAEIKVLKQSVATLIDTVSKLEELVLFYKRNQCCRSEQNLEPISLTNEMDAISEEMESLKQRVKDLECGECHKGPGHQALRRWLVDEVGLGQYTETLIKHGFEDLVAARTLTMDVLDVVDGIDKIGHKTRIMYFVRKLKDAAEETHEF